MPASSSTRLVSTTAYNDAGEAFSTADPKGIETRREFDDMGRVTAQIDNYQAFPSGADENRTTEYTYTPDSQQATVTAKMTNPADDEVTTYVYGVDPSGGSALAANNLLFAIQYPTDSPTSRIELSYNRLGQVTAREDPNGTVHEYTYDGLGRPTADVVSAFGTDIDQAVKRLTTSYTPRGQVHTLTSHSTPSSSSDEVNQVELEYNGFGQLVTDYQEHDGAVAKGGTPSLHTAFTYDDASGSAGTAAANRIRQETMTYPDGKVLKSGYVGIANDGINRVSRLEESDGGGGWQTVVRYWFLGASQTPRVLYTTANLRLDQWGGTAGTYTGLDQFNRPTAFPWSGLTPSPDVEIASLEYGYDRDSLPTYREDLQAQANSQDYDELYDRDGLNRLDDYQRGELNGGHTAMTSTNFQQTWTLDQVANWTGFAEDVTGFGDIVQTRTHNQSNEITDITNTTGTAWVQPAYDDAGNTTEFPSAKGANRTHHAVYDAWNRVVKVSPPLTTLAEYAYDARGFRVQQKEYAPGTGTHTATRDFYYTPQWQCIEERVTDVSTSTTTLDRQYYWGLRYVDDLVRRDRDTTGNGTLDETLYALNDRQFNIIALWDPTANSGAGGIVERMAYTPYGTPQFLNEDFTTKANTTYAWTTLFQGLPRDEATGLYHNRARELHPLLGRFLQRDPVGYPDGLNAYAAYHVMRAGVDPSGLSIRGWWNKTVWGVDTDMIEEHERRAAESARREAEISRQRGDVEMAEKFEEFAQGSNRRASGGFEEEVEEAMEEEYERVRNARTIGVVREVTGNDSLTTGNCEEEAIGECLVDCIADAMINFYNPTPVPINYFQEEKPPFGPSLNPYDWAPGSFTSIGKYYDYLSGTRSNNPYRGISLYNDNSTPEQPRPGLRMDRYDNMQNRYRSRGRAWTKVGRLAALAAYTRAVIKCEKECSGRHSGTSDRGGHD